MENIQASSVPANATPAGPGHLLCQARQDLRLAPEDVAQILHLSPRQIVALEQDDYTKLPGPTYIRGYLRSYAQLLGLSPDKVVESYNNLTIPSKPISLPKSAPPPQITSSDRLIKTATFGVAAIVLVLVFLWWRSEDQSPLPSSPAPAAPASEAVKPSGVTSSPAWSDAGVTSTPSPSAGGATESASSATTARVADTATPAASKFRPTNPPITASGMMLNVAPAGSSKPAGAGIPARNDRAVVPAGKAAEIPPGVPRSRLVLHAMQESWADIRDAHDNKLLYENVPAGRSVTIEGVAPFSVFLGNADGVRVQFNGQDFDVSRYKRGQVARFTLGADTTVNN